MNTTSCLGQTRGNRSIVAQSCTLSVSVQIVASRDDLAERGHPGRSVLPNRKSRELTDAPVAASRCAQDGRAPFRLRLCRAALYRRFAICKRRVNPKRPDKSNVLPTTSRRYSRLKICATTRTVGAALP